MVKDLMRCVKTSTHIYTGMLEDLHNQVRMIYKRVSFGIFQNW